MAGTIALLDLFCRWIRDNYINVTVESGRTERELVERAAGSARTPIPIDFLSPSLDGKTLIRGRVVSNYPDHFFNQVTDTFSLLYHRPLKWWITESGVRIAEDPPQGVFYVDAQGLLRDKKHQTIRITRRNWPIRYDSELKQAILAELIKDPGASDDKIARRLDSEHRVKVPPSWKAISFRAVYRNSDKKHNLEVLIDKVRRDLRERTPSAPVPYRGVSLLIRKFKMS